MPQEKGAPVLRTKKSTDDLQKIHAINEEFRERDLKASAKKTGRKYVNLKQMPLNQDALALMSWDEVKAMNMVPFDLVGKHLSVAALDLDSLAVQQKIEMLERKGYEIESFVCSPEGIQFMEHYYEQLQRPEERKTRTTVDESSSTLKKDIFSDEEKKEFEHGTGPSMINTMNLAAVSFRATDVHFQPEEKEVVMRMRRDGELYEVLRLLPLQYQLLSGEIKRASKLKINLASTPQDGNYQFTANDRQINVRVSTLPSRYGESIVLRILDAKVAMVELEQLGFSDEVKVIVQKTLNAGKGLMLVVGPTGSGKTSTLYSCLNRLNTKEIKIMTLEDPIEYELKNVIQSQISEDQGYGFSSGLRAILRQDPDTIMIGEIRDREVAEIALQASLTGHLVLSTFHATDAIAAIPRLLNMGVKDYILSSGLSLIVAQRLARRICENCKVQEQGGTFVGKGCEQCANTGFLGRIAIGEALILSEAVQKLILAGANTNDLRSQAEKDGFVSMKNDAQKKVREGKISTEEMRKVLGE